MLRASLTFSRSLHTNGSIVSMGDPYKILGLEWGATTTEVKAAYRQKALLHHPDVGRDRCPEKFGRAKRAYDAITSKSSDTGDDAGSAFSWKSWRRSDMIAEARTDVAGALRRRPSRPVGVDTSAVLGFSGSVPVSSRSDLLGNGEAPRVSSAVGSGVSKWHSKDRKEYKPWNKKVGDS